MDKQELIEKFGGRKSLEAYIAEYLVSEEYKIKGIERNKGKKDTKTNYIQTKAFKVFKEELICLQKPRY
ncbi:MAG: hypothetical protein ACYDDB_01315 [bacterium]